MHSLSNDQTGSKQNTTLGPWKKPPGWMETRRLSGLPLSAYRYVSLLSPLAYIINPKAPVTTEDYAWLSLPTFMSTEYPGDWTEYAYVELRNRKVWRASIQGTLFRGTYSSFTMTNN